MQRVKKKESLEMTEMSVERFQLTLEKRIGEGVAGYIFWNGGRVMGTAR